MWVSTSDYDLFIPFEKNINEVYLIDIYGTIVETKSSKNPLDSTDIYDWIFIGDIPSILESLRKPIILIATDFKSRLENIRQNLNLDLWIINLKSDMYRKPSLKFLELIPGEISKITYIGDSEIDNIMFDLLIIPDKKFIRAQDYFDLGLPSKPDSKEVVLLMGINRIKLVEHYKNLGYLIISPEDITLETFRHKFVAISANHASYNDRKNSIDKIPKKRSYRIIWSINHDHDVDIPEIDFYKYSEAFQPPLRSEGVIRICK